MSDKRYSEEFKQEAVKQITENGYGVADVARRLGTITHSLYAWLKKYSGEAKHTEKNREDQAEINSLRAELKRVTEERDILKKAAAYFARESQWVCVYPCSSDRISGSPTLSNDECSSQRLLCLGQTTQIPQAERG